MNTRNSAALGLFVILVGTFVFAWAGEASAQDKSKLFLEQTQTTAKNAWGLLSTIATVVVGGGALISLAAGMYQGKWGQAAISFVAGAAGLLSIWGIGQALGY
jgi:hypothetical protein